MFTKILIDRHSGRQIRFRTTASMRFSGSLLLRKTDVLQRCWGRDHTPLGCSCSSFNKMSFFRSERCFQPPLDIQNFPPAICVLPYRSHQQIMIYVVEGTHDTLPTSRTCHQAFSSSVRNTHCRGKRFLCSGEGTVRAPCTLPWHCQMGAPHSSPPCGPIWLRKMPLRKRLHQRRGKLSLRPFPT